MKILHHILSIDNINESISKQICFTIYYMLYEIKNIYIFYLVFRYSEWQD